MAAFLFVLPFGIRGVGADTGSVALKGGGLGFPALELAQWAADTTRSLGLSFTLDFAGQEAGVTDFASGNLDFVATDRPLRSDQLTALQAQRCAGIATADCIDDVPVSAEGLGFMFNLIDNAGQRITSLSLTRRTACEIFTGAIRRWNDSALVADNPELANVDRAIVPVIRADTTGESLTLSQFCITVAPDVWTAFVNEQNIGGPNPFDTPEFNAGQPTALWPPQGWGNGPVSIASDDGVADYISSQVTGPNRIGFTAVSYAQQRGFPVASVQNAAGQFVAPGPANVTAGLANVSALTDGFAQDFTISDPTAYQPAELAWVIAPNQGFDAVKGHELGLYLCWAVTVGQQVAPALEYAPLSSALTAEAIAAIGHIPGAPNAQDCAASGTTTTTTATSTTTSTTLPVTTTTNAPRTCNRPGHGYGDTRHVHCGPQGRDTGGHNMLTSATHTASANGANLTAIAFGVPALLVARRRPRRRT